ncbi:protein E6 [Eucalyptus grandis]|uniref:Uncharacterized protein n=2 Tax=Eucalyptus grandis TaxID=71139 RepID=A0ACC3M472_EUCGR|nr:protein E6 [Eucalyptus grandis]KAK3446100.1 hypothetical protein EUGRSUZ_A01856 [Eucalyptus grandis]
MAASTKLLSVLFLALVLAHSQVQARFKLTRYEEKKPQQVEIPAPAPAPEYSLAPGPAPAYVEKEYGYGLYGHDSDILPPARETYTPVTTTTTDVNKRETTATPATATTAKDDKFEEKFVREELSGESFQTGYTNNNNNYNYNNDNGYSNNENYNNNGYSNNENYNNNNNGYSNNNKYNGYVNTRETNGYANNYKPNTFTSTYSTTGQSDNYNTNGYSGNYNNNGYGTERQGMSDTRYMANGKYYYHVGSDNSYLNGHETEKAATGNYVNYDENSSNSNEFDTMEEYYKKQGYQESEEVHEP